MKSNLKFFNNSKYLPVDNFFYNVLYNKNFGYYNLKQPFGNSGDYVTSPTISNLFSEMIAIWIISTWEKIGKPKKLNIVELGPGDGSLTKTILNISKKFPKFDNAKNLYLYEISNFLKKLQKKNIMSKDVKWIRNFDKIKNGPIIFFGNEFFDAIPIKQFKRKKNLLHEKYLFLNKNYQIKEIFKKAAYQDIKKINSYKTFKNLKFIEYPKSGLIELQKVINKIEKSKGCLLLIDYGYTKSNNKNTLQSVFKHKKNFIFNNLGKADVTSHVNFKLLEEFFLKNKLSIKKTVTQRLFLQNMGIKERANIIAKKMNFREQSNIYLRLKRLLSPNLMGNLFKVILAHNFKTDKYFGFN